VSFGLIGVRACIVLGVLLSAFYVTSQLRGIGELKEGIRVRDADIAQLSTGQQALRTEIKELSAATARRELNARVITTAIDRLRVEAKEEKNACDDERLSPAYIDSLRRAAAIAAAGSVPNSARELPATDAAAGP
jgi:3-mercaptopyruvate sulfurtransferase SseA